jgi:RimJ/RimL family protein N-acetyltransferase
MADTTFTELRSTRLVLRRLRRDDLAALYAYRSLAEVARYQDWEYLGPHEAEQLIDGQANLEPDVPGTWFQLGIVVAATGILVGDCGLHCRQDDLFQMEVGITLAPTHQGQGYATEAVECLLDYVFGRLGKHRVKAVTDAENHRASALFRRLGFRQEAHFVENLWFKGQWGSELVFALLRREWEQRQSQAGRMPQVQRATIDDVPKLLPLVEAYWAFEGIAGFDSVRVSDQLKRVVSAPQFGCGWIAFVKGEAAGYLLAVYVFSLEHLGLTAEVDELLVLEQYRGQGLGTCLLRTAEAAFCEAGCTNVSLQLSRCNDTARAFYHRQGYSERSGYELLDKQLRCAHAG